MKCDQCQELLIEHAHGELDEPDRAAVSTHLGACGGCATAYCRLDADMIGIVAAHAQAPRPAVREALRKRVEAEFSPPWFSQLWQLWVRPVPVYGALVIGLLPALLWLVGGSRIEDEAVIEEPVPAMTETPAPRLRAAS